MKDQKQPWRPLTVVITVELQVHPSTIFTDEQITANLRRVVDNAGQALWPYARLVDSKVKVPKKKG